MRLRDDPVHGHEQVVQFTSSQRETRDFGYSVHNLAGYDVTLGAVVDNQLSYGFRVGEAQTAVTSGALFLVVKTDDGIYLAYHFPRTQARGTWQTHAVDSTLSDDGSTWRAKRLLPPSVDVETVVNLIVADFDGVDVTYANRLGIQTVWSLKNARVGDRIANPIDTFGREAQILGVGVGTGGIDRTTVTDVRYRPLVLGTGTQTKRLPWPITLRLDFELQSEISPTMERGQARLAFATTESNLSLDDIDTSSLTLMPCTAVTPVRNVSAVKPETVTMQGDTLEVSFDVDELIERLDGDEQTVLLTGTLTSEALSCPISFFGQDTVNYA